jgi:hypothetical protein
MNELHGRIIKQDFPPSLSDIKDWIGSNAYGYWEKVAQLIERNYPEVFNPEWLYGGQKHGWSLRYKKSKSFCTFIPEKGRFMLLVVFGADERHKVEGIRDQLSAKTLKKYEGATTYHDGKWLLLDVNDDKGINDIGMILGVKRKRRINK